MDDFESTSLIRFPSSTPQLDMVHPPPPKGNPSIRILFLLRAQRVYGRRLRAVPRFSSGAEIRHQFNDQRDQQLASNPATPGPWHGRRHFARCEPLRSSHEVREGVVSNDRSADPASPEGITVGERMLRNDKKLHMLGETQNNAANVYVQEELADNNICKAKKQDATGAQTNKIHCQCIITI